MNADDYKIQNQRFKPTNFNFILLTMIDAIAEMDEMNGAMSKLIILMAKFLYLIATKSILYTS
jgi:hypothetical protein